MERDKPLRDGCGWDDDPLWDDGPHWMTLRDFLARHDGIFGNETYLHCHKCGGRRLSAEARRSYDGDTSLFLACDDCGNQWIVSLGKSMAMKMRDRFAEDRPEHD